MKKVIIVIMVLGLLFSGCATVKDICSHGDIIKAKIRAALQIAQVGYPMIMAMAGKTTDQGILYKVALIDSALDLLGQLAYDVLCPGPVELVQAENALDQAQEAKAGLGIEQ